MTTDERITLTRLWALRALYHAHKWTWRDEHEWFDLLRENIDALLDVVQAACDWADSPAAICIESHPCPGCPGCRLRNATRRLA